MSRVKERMMPLLTVPAGALGRTIPHLVCPQTVVAEVFVAHNPLTLRDRKLTKLVAFVERMRESTRCTIRGRS